MKSIFTLCVFLATWATLGAQTMSVAGSGAGSAVAGAQVPTAIQNKQNAFTNSQAQFAAHNYSAAEGTLEAANVAAAGTPQWHFESGFALMGMAFDFKSRADASTAQAIAQLALAHFNTAEKTYGPNASPAELANERELTGYLYQYLLGDTATAKTCYQAAVNLSPNTGNAATLLAAINAREAALAQKLAATAHSN